MASRWRNVRANPNGESAPSPQLIATGIGQLPCPRALGLDQGECAGAQRHVVVHVLCSGDATPPVLGTWSGASSQARG